jgi:nucleoside-diphosphate-sugar epimerase
MTHSDDFARGFVPLLGHASALGEAFHITSDEVLTWNQVFETIARAAGAPPPRLVHIPSDWLAAWDPPRFEGTLLGDKSESVIFDLTKLRRLVPDYRPQVPFHVGVRRALAKMEAAGAQADPEEEKYFEDLIAAYQSGFPEKKN